MVDDFNLTKENAKEYFFLNQCRIINIDLGNRINADKFRSYGFDDETLVKWTNEWLASEFQISDFKSNGYGFYSIINDIGFRMNKENVNKAISIYCDVKLYLNEKQRVDILFKHKYSEVLKEHFYYGLIYIAAKNKMQESISSLLAELNLLIKDYPQAAKKEYDKNLKKVFKMYGIVMPDE